MAKIISEILGFQPLPAIISLNRGKFLNNSTFITVNKKNCGIMQVMGTRQQTKVKDDNISGIPVVKSYKYLGLHIDERLSVENHCNKMKRKTILSYVQIEVDIIPVNITKFKANMWHIFIRTLIEPGLFFNIVNTRTKNKIIVSWARATFKAMCTRQNNQE